MEYQDEIKTGFYVIDKINILYERIMVLVQYSHVIS